MIGPPAPRVCALDLRVRDPQSTTIPNGAAPPGIEIGDPSISWIVVASTEKAETFATPASTMYRFLPSGETAASNGRRPVGAFIPVEPTRVRVPSAATA